VIRLFLADDMPAVREVLRHAVKSVSNECIVVGEAADGLEALSRIPALAPDLVIMDVDMPGMDGLAVAYELRRLGDRTPVLFCSGVIDPPLNLPPGVVGYLRKPLPLKSLAAAIESVSSRGAR
jgi:two-component system response regulator MprA